MIWRALLATALTVGAVAPVSTAAGAQAPRQDAVVLTGGPGQAGMYTGISLNAASGPSGESPSGQVRATVFGSLNLGGRVTCLAVRGTTATMNFRDQTSGLGIITVEVVDDQPDTFDAIPTQRAPSDCSPLGGPTGFGGPLSGADITVVDAPPLPTSKERCKHGGWGNFGSLFKNQGQCVAFVERGSH